MNETRDKLGDEMREMTDSTRGMLDHRPKFHGYEHTEQRDSRKQFSTIWTVVCQIPCTQLSLPVDLPPPSPNYSTTTTTQPHPLPSHSPSTTSDASSIHVVHFTSSSIVWGSDEILVGVHTFRLVRTPRTHKSWSFHIKKLSV